MFYKHVIICFLVEKAVKAAALATTKIPTRLHFSPFLGATEIKDTPLGGKILIKNWTLKQAFPHKPSNSFSASCVLSTYSV